MGQISVELMNYIIPTLIIGVCATALTDLWSVIRKALLGVPLPDFGLVGRWIAHMRHGRFRHDSIKAAAPVRQHVQNRDLPSVFHFPTASLQYELIG